tara:strand:+ start:168 stop:524 length:357 start_codon:yes stop_codon:yes gene_type:complete
MRSILINPINETISEIFYAKHKEHSRLEWIKNAIDVRTISGIRLDDNGNYLYVDDEGMLLNMNYFFKYTNNDYYVEPVILAGKGLVVSTDEDGNDIDSELTLGDLRPKIEFLGRKALH